jgi:hypothetical protein
MYHTSPPSPKIKNRIHFVIFPSPSDYHANLTRLSSVARLWLVSQWQYKQPRRPKVPHHPLSPRNLTKHFSILISTRHNSFQLNRTDGTNFSFEIKMLDDAYCVGKLGEGGWMPAPSWGALIDVAFRQRRGRRGKVQEDLRCIFEHFDWEVGAETGDGAC